MVVAMSLAEDLDVSPEERRSTRHTVGRSSGIRFDGIGRPACFVKDMSDTGAYLNFDPSTILPKEFTLLLPNEDIEFRCLVVRSGVGCVAVEFVGEGKPIERYQFDW